jgi:hypothetical protein
MLERSDEVGVRVTLNTEPAVFMRQVPDPSAGAVVRFASADAGTELRRTGRGWLLTVAGTGVDGHVVTGRIELLRDRPGPTATRWRLPPNPIDHSARHLSWSALAATSTLRGELSIDGRQVALDGWRASLEHVWGRVDGPRGWRYGQSFTVHLPRGGAVIAFGLNREDAAIGWGARDGQWLGVLAQLRRGRTRLCRPLIQRREWNVGDGFSADPFAERMRARCGRLAVDFRRAGEHSWGGGGPGWYRISWPATVDGRGAGVGTALGWR